MYSCIADAYDDRLIDIARGKRPDIVEIVHKVMDGEEIDTGRAFQRNAWITSRRPRSFWATRCIPTPGWSCSGWAPSRPGCGINSAAERPRPGGATPVTGALRCFGLQAPKN